MFFRVVAHGAHFQSQCEVDVAFAAVGPYSLHAYWVGFHLLYGVGGSEAYSQHLFYYYCLRLAAFHLIIIQGCTIGAVGGLCPRGGTRCDEGERVAVVGNDIVDFLLAVGMCFYEVGLQIGVCSFALVVGVVLARGEKCGCQCYIYNKVAHSLSV